MKFSLKTLFACGTSALCVTFAANAQSVDYNTLQQTFGEPVTTSATGKPQRASDVPADMIIITQDQIRRSGATKLIDILKFVPGIDMRSYGDAAAEVNVHGYLQPSTPRLLVLVNGRQVYLDYYGYVSWDTIPVQLGEIQQIEIVKGPGSSLFGFNAVSGVINIITIDPLKTPMAQLSATAGTFGLVNTSAVIARQISSTLAVKASGGYTRQKAYRVAPGLSAPIDPESENVALNVDWQADANVLVRGETTWAKSQEYQLTAPGGFSNGSITAYSFKLSTTADTSLGLIDVTAYRNHTTARTTLPVYGSFAILNDVTVLSASDLFKVSSDVAVRLATEFRDNINTAFPALPKSAARVVSGSAMVDWAILPELSWTN